MRLLIAIDDTDNKDSRGTGFQARQLAKLLELKNLGEVLGITRHQLFVHDSIAYTSQNSSACLVIESNKLEEIINYSAGFLKEVAAEGSDAGLCVMNWEKVMPEIEEWGIRAKKEVLRLNEALDIALRNNVYLEGFTGTRIGQIGALAAVGLRHAGNDGRFIWLRGTKELRDFDKGIYTVEELRNKAGIDQVKTLDGLSINGSENIYCNGWTRPVLKKNLSVLFVEKVNFADYGWKTVTKEYIRKIS
ncbi:MAG: hypothetical protein K9G76_08925 [Bacteroidales bacterium]|nr:hypothetical protein [Bacteroidales bacterium]MCF8405593.1 hypothetical protein [Bacteroidales bacterium]